MRRGTLALLAITILAYLPTFRAGFIWDDDSYVEHNAALRSLDGLWRIWTDTSATPQYYPLVHTTFWVEQHLWGTASAVPFHVANVLLHATAAVLLWRLLTRLLPPWPLQRPPLAAEAAPPVVRTAWLAAALWAVHPVQVESVAWVTERKNVLAGVFYLLAFGACLTAAAADRVEPRRYAIAFCLFLLALFSKTVTATLPAAVLLVLWWKRGRLTRRDVLPLVPFFLAGAVLGLHTGHLERVRVGAQGREFAFTPVDRLLIAGRAVCFYAAKLAVPYPLSFIYPRWTIDPHQPWQYAGPVAVVAVIVGLWALRRRLGRGPLAAALFFVGTLFPALGFANVYPMRYSFVADHFQYLACIGPVVLVAAALHALADRGGLRWVPAIVLACFGTLTFARSTAYRDRLTLWSDTVATNPGSWMAHTNLGHALVARHRLDEAWAQYQRAAQLAPDLPEPHFNLGVGHATHGDLAAAEAEFQAAINTDPDYAPAYADLAKLYLQQSRVPAALAMARRATAIAPGMPTGHAALGLALERSGRLPEAAAEYATAVDEAPDDARGQAQLADALNRLGRTAAAAEHYGAAVSLDPTNAAAWTSLGYLMLRAGRPAEAATSFRHALSVEPRLTLAAQGLRQAGGVP